MISSPYEVYWKIFDFVLMFLMCLVCADVLSGGIGTLLSATKGCFFLQWPSHLELATTTIGIAGHIIMRVPNRRPAFPPDEGTDNDHNKASRILLAITPKLDWNPKGLIIYRHLLKTKPMR